MRWKKEVDTNVNKKSDADVISYIDLIERSLFYEFLYKTRKEIYEEWFGPPNPEKPEGWPIRKWPDGNYASLLQWLTSVYYPSELQ